MPEIVIASIRGPILELQHSPDIELGVFDRLRTESGIGAAVALRDRLRSWAISDTDHDSLVPGQPLVRVEPEVVTLSPERLIAVGIALTQASPVDRQRVCETGVKVIDVLMPMIEGGVSWLLGGPYLGRMKLLEELHIRLARRRAEQTLVFPIAPDGVSTAATNLALRPDFPQDAHDTLKTVWLITEHVDNHALAQIDLIGTTRIFCGPRMPARGYWPSIDPLASRSTALAQGWVESAHVDQAVIILETLSWAERMRGDSEFNRLANERSFAAAIFRTIELAIDRAGQLDEADSARLESAEKLEHFFAQALHVGEAGSGTPATYVSLEESLVGCRSILAGHSPRVGFDFPRRLGT